MVTGWMPEHHEGESEPSAPVVLPEGAEGTTSDSEQASG
jgi:hypothetical protein